MKKIITILAISILLISCSSSNDGMINEIPESFNIKVEIKAKTGSTSPRVDISIGSLVVKKWENVDLPFTSTYAYNNSGYNEVCNCITIKTSAYLSEISEMQEFNLFVNGNIVDTTTVISSSIGGVLTPTTLEFVYDL